MPGLEVCGFDHGERRGEACKKVTVVLAIGHPLRAHEALGSPDALPGFLEVVHRLFEDGVFVGHEKSIRAGILRSPDCFAFSRLRERKERQPSELCSRRNVLGLLRGCLGHRSKDQRP